MTPMMTIDGARLLKDLRELAGFGSFGTGVDRPAFSDADMAARRWVCDRLAQAGLDAAIDNVGNVLGRADADRAVLIGSHTDTVPKGGWLDGALGVVYGIEIARTVRQADIAAGAGGTGVDVISFQEEEGAFLPLMGSRAFCGEVSGAEFDAASNGEGRGLRQAIADWGLDGNPPARVDAKRHTAYLEAHIEQGPRLEAADLKIGVVTGLVGIRRFRINCAGQADHAGTTPMDMRRDAGAALVRLATALLDMFEAEAAPETVWNIGQVTFRPGAFNVVPEAAELLVEFRDTSPDRLVRLGDSLAAVVAAADGASNVAVTAVDAGGIAPAQLDQRLQAAITAAAADCGAPSVALQSGAGHDAMVLSKHVPAAMMFIPSIGGRSHHVAENTSDDDIVLGCRVLARAVETLIT